jgi:tRNA uridine 5-carbamoylmethylation protein Kti12
MGRVSELQQINHYFDVHHPGQRVVVLWGLPGFGKTQLALRYKNQNEKQYKCTMWADASSLGSMRDSFLAIAEEMDSRVTLMSEERRVILAVKQWLKAKTNGEWLLILDGYDNESFDIRPFSHLKIMAGSS